MIKKIGLKKVLLIIVLLILGIVSILLAILLNNKKEVEIPEIEQPPSSGLLGNDRIEAQEKVYAIIGNYIKNIPDLSNYIQNSEIKIFIEFVNNMLWFRKP